jgi:GNAT superfamily N-acetyltransferase
MPQQDIIEIRRATALDADDISRVVIRALRMTNAQHYPAHVIDAAVANFAPDRVAERLICRHTFVATANGAVVGTASLDGSMIRSVFVAPEFQDQGIGRRLMDSVEELALAHSVAKVSVPSSVSAQGFYERLGFVTVREDMRGDERIILMKKELFSIE